MTAEDFKAWFGLLYSPGLSRQAARALLQAFGSPQAVLGASPAQWRAVAGAEAAQALTTPDPAAATRLAHALAWLAEHPARQAIALGDPHYPEPLLHCGDPPLMMFVEGSGRLLLQPAVAVVGSRQATPQGLANARQFAAALSQAGVTVVSGLATGIDGAAHEGALQGAGSTVAVIGTGPDIVYPRRHAGLARRIVELGAVVSEYAPGTPVLAHHFPHRNRLIAGLTRATLVIEATLKSGSLITARLASECGRDVFAVPGSIHSPQSSGCHTLIRQGAQLVEAAQEILQALNLPSAPPAATAGAADAANGLTRPGSGPQGAESRLLQALGHDPVALDALVGRTGWPAAMLGAHLLELELQGRVARLPGGLFQRQQGC
jgi:DNA processing protein